MTEQTETRLVVKMNKDLKMSKGKYAAQAIHAALLLTRSHHGGPVVVLGGTKGQVQKCDVVVVDSGRTEVKPNSTTAGAYWDERVIPLDKVEALAVESEMQDKEQSVWSNKTYADAKRELQHIWDNVFEEDDFWMRVKEWLDERP